MKLQQERQKSSFLKQTNKNVSNIKVKLIQSPDIYPFKLNEVSNFIQLTYTCLIDKNVGKEMLGIQVIGGYRKLKLSKIKSGQNLIRKQILLEHNLQEQVSQECEGQRQQFMVVFILLVQNLQKKINKNSNSRNKQRPQFNLYVPYNIYNHLKKMNLKDLKLIQNTKIKNSSLSFQNSNQPLKISYQQNLQVQVARFPIIYDKDLIVKSIDEELEKIVVSNIRLPDYSQVQNNEIKQVITKIIVHPKFSSLMKNKPKSQSQQTVRQQHSFLLFPQAKSKQVSIDFEWLDENRFLNQLQKLSLKTKAKLIRMNKINHNSNKNKLTNSIKNYLQFQITPIVKNQELLKSKKLFIAKIIPGKTVIEFDASSNFNASLNPFIQTLRISPIYKQVFQNQPFFVNLSQKIISEIIRDTRRNKVICLKTDKSIGIGALLRFLTQNFMKQTTFIKINCQKFATLKQFFNKLKTVSSNGKTLIFIKNLTWLQNLSKNEQIVQDTMKSLIQKINQTLETSYQSSMCNFTMIMYFSHNQIPEQLPKDTKRIISNLEKEQKLSIINRVFQYLQNSFIFNQSMREIVKNMLINSVGWTRIYKFLLNLQKDSSKQQLSEKNLASKIQRVFSLENVQNVTQVSWSDIGGLQTAKQEIIQTVLLPTKHPEIFDEWIRPRTGLLFYGPPGTGKTLLGKCIAKQCKMGFISVKGPQLLNMYVGQSEKNVRQVFQRAKESKPCIVFMDELDALVPKRGNSSDSNAVMDRIVAQLLMQIDMASQNQVFVIGATNRPDLLDPSILRAGRFDKQIYLGISKNKQDRIKILKAQTRNSKLSQSFDYELIQKNVPLNFTGADFYGLTSKSMMRAVQRSIEEYEKGQVSDPDVVITTDDFLFIIPSVKPSVSEEQLRHYESLKQRFSF